MYRLPRAPIWPPEFFDRAEIHPSGKVIFLGVARGQGGDTGKMQASQGRLAIAEKLISPAQIARVTRFNGSVAGEPFDGQKRIRLPDPLPHLQPLDQKFGLDHSSDPGFEIEKIVTASAIVGDAGEHVFNLPNEIRAFPRV